MSSTAKIAANQANAKLSTGPVTEQGKATSSRNATRHGLTGSQIVIQGEDPAEYELLRDELYASYKPANAAEKILVEQIAASSWKFQRAQRVEAEATSDCTVEKLAAILTTVPDELLRIQRYVRSFERSFYKAIGELKALQKSRAANKKEKETNRQNDDLISSWLEGLSEPVGFVSQEPQTESADAKPEAPGSRESERLQHKTAA